MNATKTRAPTVSVCIVNWNCRDQLADCLRSLSPRRQRVRVEVVVVDNASTDGAADMVERDFPHVQLVRNATNAGFARGCNQAAEASRGRYLFFLNNDTRVPRGALQALVRHHRAHPEIGLLGPKLRDGRGRVQASVRRLPTVPALLHRLAIFRWTGLFRRAYRAYRGRGVPTTTGPAEVLMGAALLMPRAVYRTVGGWSESYTFGGEDIDLCARVRRLYPVVYHPEAEVTHLGRVSSRRHAGYAHTNTLVGITRSLREAGASPLARAFYKVALTLDLPLAGSLQVGRYLWARLRRREKQAERSRLELAGMGHFLRRGLWAFWRA